MSSQSTNLSRISTIDDKEQRFISIDILRALSIVLMVIIHSVIYTSSGGDYDQTLYFVVNSAIGVIPAPLFVFLMGMSLSIMAYRWKQLGLSESRITVSLIIRGFLIFTIGLVFAGAVWGIKFIFIWDILTLLGFSTILLTLIRNWNSIVLTILALIIVLVAPILRQLFGYPKFWEYDEYQPPIVLEEIIGGFLLNGYFPVLPWVSFAILGYVVGRFVLLNENENIRERNRRVLIIFGISFIVSGFLAFGVGSLLSEGFVKAYLMELEFYHLSFTMFLILLGICFILFWVLHIMLDLKKVEYRWFYPFRVYSLFSLTVYILHHIPIVLIPRIVGWIQFGDDYYYYKNIFSALEGLLIGLTLVVIFYQLLVLWNKFSGKFSFEWVIRSIYKYPVR
ncbi:MAG: heparan-alpha-glucosaminide N-acetyltransferase domain-containing protein [Spirochaetia bacterium]|nr:heparan-alpha-glucosaminide N-acetyltransferase domain-containing protein [Spirochaetota bacterium]MCX8096729.1 heparan-alpha-glucosaminide N-acetyltransferase domain-containing protein [Spirochaetota bacterium]MDW8112164.1 heparan-alpha-glucosaminide N-acetyltransferase domain-containing protein [Spirochaetia bacterium]